ncbi:MAG: hypothetical protein JNL44_05915 [Gemmatimonadetes bacterium]|nr:hypothetical protein [Gemmatimonadota bacterium]
MCRNRASITRRALVLATAAAMAVPAAAQSRVVDEGTFSLFVGGVRVGREDFSIRTVGGGASAGFVAQGNVLRGEVRLAVRLNTSAAGSPLLFTLEETRDGRLTESLTGESRRELWSGRSVRPEGERAREFRFPAGSLAAEAVVMHHLWFLIRFGEGRTTDVLHPRSLQVEQVSIEDAGPDRVSLGLREFVTRRWVIRPSGGEGVREAWTDLEGRLLRVRVPGEDLEAVRDEPPAETPGGGRT